MLSYRHAFHAGNHADALKHLCEVLILNYLNEKASKPYCYIDTHAGPGRYRLTEGFAAQNKEYELGIRKLWDTTLKSTELKQYLEQVKQFNPNGSLVNYPGSPAIAQQLILPNCRMQLFELHTKDHQKLQKWADKDKRVKVFQQDGFKGLIANLPPKERRGLVLIDPPYEVKEDYITAKQTLEEALKRFANGVYLLWLPKLQNKAEQVLVKKLKAMPVKSLYTELSISDEASQGMYGSAVFVVNPPWLLEQQLQSCLPELCKLLSLDGAGTWSVNTYNIES